MRYTIPTYSDTQSELFCFYFNDFYIHELGLYI